MITFSRKQCRLDLEMRPRKGARRANLWRTCVRSLIHDIPARRLVDAGNPVSEVAGHPGATARPHWSSSSPREFRPPGESYDRVFVASSWPSRGQGGRRQTRLMVSIGSRARCRTRWRRDRDSWFSTLTCQPSLDSPSTDTRPPASINTFCPCVTWSSVIAPWSFGHWTLGDGSLSLVKCVRTISWTLYSLETVIYLDAVLHSRAASFNPERRQARSFTGR